MSKQVMLAASAVAVLMSCTVNAATEIQWWHAMGGSLGDKVNEIAEGYNATQDQFVVKPVFKGSYPETMTGAIAAFRAKQQPHIVQVYEVGTATMMSADKAIYPVHQLMNDSKEKFDPTAFLPSVTGYYTANSGEMLSMPFNSSTPVLYYNKSMFEKAGLSDADAPKTWNDLELVATKLLASGAQCGFTTGYQSWVQLENFAARHNVAFASNDNGFGGLDTELLVNNKAFVDHISKLEQWSKTGAFKYGGRASDAASLFYSGECAMYMNSSASYAGIKENMPNTEFGVSELPYWPSVIEQPQNSIIGGASLWVLQGHPKQDYEGVAEFFSYLSSAKVQADWHQFTGYLPITQDAFELTESQNFYQENPGTRIAIEQMTAVTPTKNSKGLRLGNFVQIRDVVDEELEQVWSGKQSAQQALDAVTARSNELLKNFERVNSKS
ncbi:sn-glycerol-3-phosphate ABC transporter substrate-binding protein UgpB [Alginatibacterium sediminis]|uniref:sn-glycerol-3-phosphate-binding periplasmic protein UgpB n=1 Tax=Alginatibacterium sediminis TaxID=2164068 RepID=A0A420EHR8_9ALTE|nr:sn-glycerol-3-phosphate ABC transporter substrate-binding protein UgpB [Alginatibacterium sediminis]RKF20233.1 sn-glycerol-3-phosphate ABC transporter substrate-binding protein UgpB [Alginatibacterium sediminis]